LEYLLNKKPETIWEEYVPIVKSGNTYTVYLTDQIDVPANYNQLMHVLTNATTLDTIKFIINNGGGVIDTGFMLINAINNTDAHTVAHITGTVASVATIIALSCDTLICDNHISFMIHNYSAAVGHQKGHELKAYQNFTDRELNKTFRIVYANFLTEKEMTDVIEGKDIWLNKEEVLERWERTKETVHEEDCIEH